ncbi:MAG: HipA N-terminal domain-containing protein [Bacteroidaceae bacterium]|nr:HipA N-terminal domain-containing protein [Bacteroidaceae bacterium]
MRQLGVYYNNVKAGVLTEQTPGRGYEFRYDPTYLLSGGKSISVTLPRNREIFKSDSLFPFFTNMLPEGANRSIICRHLRIDENDFFGMLSAMAGKDFIGAVHVKAIQ